ncbi:MAG: MFS transporter [Betaproteobacteria bacterium]|nr:MFS transporter [Betaproteobacteria bacterium]
MREAVGKPAFWYFYMALLLCGIGLFVPMVHLAPYARDHGLTVETGAFLTGLIGLGSMIGRFGLAGIGDRLPRTILLAATYLMMGGGLLLWLVSSMVLPLAIFAIVFGTGYGGMVALAPAITMDYFGARNLAGILASFIPGPVSAWASVRGWPVFRMTFMAIIGYRLQVRLPACSSQSWSRSCSTGSGRWAPERVR